MNNNCKIISSESNFFISNYILNESLNSIFILFPEPWNTNKKKRLIQISFLKLLHQKLKKNNFLFISTDDEGYKNWCLKLFDSQKENWENQFDSFNIIEPEEVKCEERIEGGYKTALENTTIYHLKFKRK